MMRAVLLLCFFASAASAAERIGQAIPITGVADRVAARLEEGMSMALTDALARGMQPEVTLVDTGCDAEKARTAGRTLKEAGVEIVVGPLCTEAARIIAELVAPVPVVSLDTRNPLLQRQRTVGGLPLFEIGPGPEAEAAIIVDKVLPRFGTRPFALIDDGSVYARGLSDAVRLKAQDAGVRPTEVANFRPLQRTQKPLLRRLARSGIEALVIAADAEDVATIAHDLAELGYDWTIATGEAARLLPFVEGAANVPDGLLAVMPAGPTAAAVEALKTRLALPDDEVSDTLLLGYALMTLALSHDPQSPLVGTGTPTLLGLLTFGEDGRSDPLPFALHRWERGTFKRITP